MKQTEIGSELLSLKAEIKYKVLKIIQIKVNFLT